MILTIILPKATNHHDIVTRSNAYFSNANKGSKILDDKKRFSISIGKNRIKIFIYSEEEQIMNELNRFISYVFFEKYIGIIGQHHAISPKNVKVYWL